MDERPDSTGTRSILSSLDEYRAAVAELVSSAPPSPEIYTTAIARMGTSPEQTLIVEDAPHGVEAARRAGAHVCQVSGFTDVDYFRIRAAIDRAERGSAARPGRAVAA